MATRRAVDPGKQGNRASSISIGDPSTYAQEVIDPSAIEASAIDATSPAEIVSMNQTVTPEPDPTPAAPAPAAEPPQGQAPATPAPTVPAPASPEDEELAKWKALDEEKRFKEWQNARHMIGRHAEEVGMYRKVFDKFVQNPPTAQPPAAPAPETPAANPVDNQNLLTEFLTDPDKFIENRVIARMEQRTAQKSVQQQLQEERAKVAHLWNDPKFVEWVAQVPKAYIDAADSDPQAFKFLIGTYPGAQAPAAPAPVAQPPVAPAPVADRVVKLGKAAGIPSDPKPENTAPTFTRAQLAKMMVEKPYDYARLQPQIAEAYRQGKVR